jgi:hypothetical protein
VVFLFLGDFFSPSELCCLWSHLLELFKHPNGLNVLNDWNVLNQALYRPSSGGMINCCPM